jgi:hypothetical protein
MYQEHDTFESPESNSRIWRYMNLAKFIDLFSKRALFFARADKFIDPYEGQPTKENLRIRGEASETYKSFFLY